MKIIEKSFLLAVALTAPAACARPSSTAASTATRPAPADRPAEVGAVIDAYSEDGIAVRLRVDAIEPDPEDPDRELTLYGLSAQVPGSGAWTPYCLPDRHGRSRAIPVEGTWDARGNWSAGDGAITFACTNGAIGKCMRFGYRPWKEAGGRSLRDHHLACVRMVRADYCGDGTPHTRDGTRINMYDPLGIQERAPDDPDDPQIFEAGWSPAGATYLHRPRLSDRTAEIVAECPEKLAGRVAGEGEAPLPTAEILRRFPETVLFNEHFTPR
jgi:ADYC domain